MNRSENGLPGQNLQALLQEGLQAHQAGRLADAEAAYRRVLACTPKSTASPCGVPASAAKAS
ncbi:MAG: hypothetical protein VB959_09865, partial [Rhodospirillales bacterium]